MNLNHGDLASEATYALSRPQPLINGDRDMATTTEQNGLVYSSSQEEILDVVCGLIDESRREYAYDRRRHDRHSLAVLVKATPIKDSRRLGTEIEVLTHDISAGGLAFVSNAPIDEQYISLRFPGFSQRPLILEVLRQTKMGPFWMIAGSFQTDL